MNSKPKYKFNYKDYIFLTLCLIIFFTVSMYIMGSGALKGPVLIASVIGIIIVTPIVLFVLKKLNDDQE